MKKFLFFILILTGSVFAQNTYVISLDGGESFYVKDDALNLLDVSTAWTFEAWINVHDYTSGNYDCIMDRRTVFSFYLIDDDDKDYAVAFVARSSNDTTLAYMDCDGTYSTSADMEFNTWYHVAATYDGTTAKLYVNGNEMDSDKDSAWALSSTGYAVNFGGRYWGSYSRQMEDADIDEIRISDIARTLKDMQTATTDAEYSADRNTILLMHLDTKDDSPTYETGVGFSGEEGDKNISSYDYIAQSGLPLDGTTPVQLTSFSANAVNGGILLTWETATEVNNYGFSIERSADKNNWEEIGFVEGHGNSNSPNTYSFTDNTAKGNESYRLKQLDFDGNYEYSDVVTANAAGLNKVEFKQNYPNPFNPSTTFSFVIPSKVYVTLAIYNSLGQQVATVVSENLKAGNYQYNWNAQNLSSGVYFAKLTAGTTTQIQKIMLMK